MTEGFFGADRLAFLEAFRSGRVVELRLSVGQERLYC